MFNRNYADMKTTFWTTQFNHQDNEEYELYYGTAN